MCALGCFQVLAKNDICEDSLIKVVKSSNGVVSLYVNPVTIYTFVRDLEPGFKDELRNSIGNQLPCKAWDLIDNYSSISIFDGTETIYLRSVYHGALAIRSNKNDLELLTYVVYINRTDGKGVIYKVNMGSTFIKVRNIDEFEKYFTGENTNYLYEKYVLKQASDGFYDFIHIKTPLESALGV